MKSKSTNTIPVEELGYDRRIGRYHLTVKIGKVQPFDSFSYTNQKHHHDCYELVIVTDGSGSFEDNGNIHILKKGDLYISAPYSEHEIHVAPSESMTVFYLFFRVTEDSTLSNNSFEERLLRQFLLNHDAFCHKTKGLLAYLDFIRSYGNISKNRNDPWLSRIAFEFLFNCLDHLSTQKGVQDTSAGIHDINIFERTLDYIDQNIEKKLTAPVIADAVGLSKSSLYALFREHLDCTVHDYIKEKKVALAKHYLVMNTPVTEVAGLVGFDSLPQFSRTFKHYTGLSPRTFQKENAENPMGIGRRLSH